MSPSVQENLARVRAGLWDHDEERDGGTRGAADWGSWHEDRGTKRYDGSHAGSMSPPTTARMDGGLAVEEVDHDAILAQYDQAISEHEAGLERARDALRGHVRRAGHERREKRRRSEAVDEHECGRKVRRDGGHGAAEDDVETRRKDRQLRFRFKDERRSARKRRREAGSLGSDASEFSGTQAPGTRHSRRSRTSTRAVHKERDETSSRNSSHGPDIGGLEEATVHPLPREDSDSEAWLDDTRGSAPTLDGHEQYPRKRHHHDRERYAGEDNPWDADDYEDAVDQQPDYDAFPDTKRAIKHDRPPSSRSTRKRHRTASPSAAYHPSNSAEADDEARVNPAAAFRDSLFDALADDEGAAAYWEGVYGQPINIYARPEHTEHQPASDLPRSEDNDNYKDDVQRMSDDEYAAYVMRRMWERANPHVLQARKEHDRQRRRRAERQSQARSHDRPSPGPGFAGQRASAPSSAQEREKYLALWEGYISRWTTLTTGPAAPVPRVDDIPWPTDTYARTGQPDGPRIRAFLQGVCEYVAPSLAAMHRTGTRAKGKDEEDGTLLLRSTRVALLKAERFRWHPDKVMQRFGGRTALGEEVLGAVTGVFQVVDGMLEALKRDG